MKVEFWNKYALFYNLFMKKDEKMYREMFSLIRRQVMGKTVLEVATGTGLIAKNIADCTKRTDATDYSEKMIQQAKKNCNSKNLTFSIQNAYHLTFADDSYDVVIISNALHIMTDPEKALQEIGRVLKKRRIAYRSNLCPGKYKRVSVFTFKSDAYYRFYTK